jgi:hypothetical protein
MTIPSRLISACIVLTALILVAGSVTVWQSGMTTSAAGLAAKLMCSGVFVAKRSEQDVLTADIRPTSVVMSLPRIAVDHQGKTVSAGFPGLQDRHAVWRDGRGCTLLAVGKRPEPSRRSIAIADRSQTNDSVAVGNDSAFRFGSSAQLWPIGTARLSADQWPSSVDAEDLSLTVKDAFTTPKSSSFSPLANASAGLNTRALLIAHRGKLLVERYGGGFNQQTPQLGLSMAKSVLSSLVWKSFTERGIDFKTPVVDLMNRVPKAQWAADWLRDERASITLSHLVRMQDGLDHVEGQSMLSDALYMLFSKGDTSQYAATVALKEAPGNTWRYSSAVSNLLSRVLRDQFPSDDAYWKYPRQSVFDPIGAQSAVLETDDTGTFVASTYMWATPQDWLRIGLLLANDGSWGGRQVFPAGWYKWASQAVPDGENAIGPYGAHVWLTNSANKLDCEGSAKLPANGIVMAGHWGQMLAMFPDQEVVILRMGWTSNDAVFKPCELFSQVLSAIK